MSSTLRVTIGTIVTTILGLLVMRGAVDPNSVNTLSQYINDIIGGMIAIIGIFSYFEHHIQQEKNKGSTPTTTITTKTDATPAIPITTTEVTQS